jgi:hypothetical protein
MDPVSRVVAEAEIRRVTASYCRGIDRLDLDAVRACYHPDATDEHGSFSGTVDEYLEWVARLLRRYRFTMHILGQQLVEFDSPSSARVETYGVSCHESDDTDPRLNLTTGFRFVDRFERVGGRWAISRRVAVTEWSRAGDPARRWPVPDNLRTGARGPDDPVYWV